jgi:hypothetical protein
MRGVLESMAIMAGLAMFASGCYNEKQMAE